MNNLEKKEVKPTKSINPLKFEVEAKDLITDGFGNYWSPICEKCGEKTTQVVRPGKAACPNCS